MDYRNNLFTSSDPRNIIHFYEGFVTRDELIEWMKERPKGSCEIVEVEGENDIIVVIPTMDFEGEYARRCREEIFKGLHIIFVVSGKGNNYFNYAHNCNLGIKKAMEYNPKWIVLSNDDMIKVDSAVTLQKKLKESTDSADVIVNYDFGDNTHSFRIGKVNYIGKILYKIFKHKIKLNNTYPSVFKRFIFYEHIKGRMNLDYQSFYDNVHNSFVFRFKHLLHHSFDAYFIPGHFSIYSSKFINKMRNELFNEFFINAHEDDWLGINLTRSKVTIKQIDYKIDSIGGSSLGRQAFPRSFRDMASLVLLNHYIECDYSDFET